MSDHTHYKEPITREEAEMLANKWLRAHMWFDEKHRNTQLMQLMSKLSMQCSSYILENGEDEGELEIFLDDAYELVSNIHYFQKRDKNSFEIFDEEIELEHKYTRNDYIIWPRKDPSIALEEGFESEEYFAGDKSHLHSLVIDYIKQDWLRHPFLDWVFMDIMITNELCAYGEDLKRKLFPGKKDFGSNKDGSSEL